MRKQKKGFTVVELVVVIAIVAVLAAVMIPTFTSIIRKANDSAYLQERTNQQLQDLIEKVENQNYLTWEDFEAKLAAAMADSANDTSAKITEAVKNALSGISGAGLSEEQVKKIVEKALEGQLTVTQVEAIVYNAIKGISVEGLTQSEVKAIVNNAIRNIPQTGVTKEQVTAAINSAIAGLTDAQKQAITAAVNSALEKFTSEAITAEDVQKIVEAVISGQSSKITLTLNKDNLSLNVGASETLVATVTPEGTEIGWASSDTSVATVSNGTVTAVAAGNATITVTAGGATVTCAVTVTEAQVINANPKIKIVEGDGGALYLEIDKSDMGEYADQVAYYTISFSTDLGIVSETYNLNKSYTFSLDFDSRSTSNIPYIGWSCDYPSNMGPSGSTGTFSTVDDIKYELISDSTADSFAFKNIVWIVVDSVVQKAMIENNNISVTDSVSCVFSYSDYKYHFYINLTEEEYNALCDVYGESIDVFKAVENENGKYEIDVEAGANYEDYSKYTIKAYAANGALLGTTTYENAYSQWKNGESIVVVDGYEDNFLNTEENIADSLAGNSNTFGYYKYVLETRGTSTKFWTDKIGE
ncbi:MAG: Ig domain-containing protein [Clostridia bacterium]|nr:Ig domain-containing protein [Clostridia bacterium]